MRIRFLIAAAVGCAAMGAHADLPHDRIARERVAASVRFADQQRQCESRFVVAPCLEEARQENRATLAQLRQQELELDDGQRRAAANARRKAIAEKLEARQSKASDASPEPPRVRVRREPVVPSDELPVARMPVSPADRPGLEQLNRARFESREREAQSHREAVARRNADRLVKGKLAPPLPNPSGASAPG